VDLPQDGEGIRKLLKLINEHRASYWLPGAACRSVSGYLWLRPHNLRRRPGREGMARRCHDQQVFPCDTRVLQDSEVGLCRFLLSLRFRKRGDIRPDD